LTRNLEPSDGIKQGMNTIDELGFRELMTKFDYREINQRVLLLVGKGCPAFPALIHRAGDHPSR
jgi:hypothetical protein